LFFCTFFLFFYILGRQKTWCLRCIVPFLSFVLLFAFFITLCAGNGWAFYVVGPFLVLFIISFYRHISSITLFFLSSFVWLLFRLSFDLTYVELSIDVANSALHVTSQSSFFRKCLFFLPPPIPQAIYQFDKLAAISVRYALWM
jgi:hypothetical protein